MKTVVNNVNDTNETGAANAMSTTKVMKAANAMSATKTIKTRETMNATKAIKTREAMSTTKVMKAANAMSTTKTIKTKEAMSTTKVMKAANAMSATKVIKERDKTVESKKKQAYHLIMRGNDRKKVFGDDKDYKKFLSLLSNLMQRFDALLYAFTLMTNHIHLLVKIADIELFTEYLTKAYTGYFYYRYKKPGRLFEPSLFYPKNSVYLKMNIIIYILNNSTLANMSTQPWTYKYNSYLFYTMAYNEFAKYVKVEPSIIRKNFSSLDSFKDLLRSEMVLERAEKRFKYIEDEW